MKSEVVILLVLSLFIGSSYGQSISCTYSNFTYNNALHYGCFLNINNPAGFDDFTEINGTHAEGRGNADVTVMIASGRTINFPQIICSQFPNMLAVDYSWRDVVAINENTLSGCRSLEWLSLWWNEIEEIHERAFANNPNLVFLDLDLNQLESLPENVFNGLTNLERLELSNNRLGTLPAGIFNGLTSLDSLYLANIRITEVNPAWFVNIPNLRLLTVYANNITSFSPAALSALSNLQVFEISRNPLGSLPDTFFDGFTNLETIYMASIGIREINPRWWQNLGNLQTLYIYSNLYTSIPANAFQGLQSLLVLDIGDNHLTETAIPEDLFDNTPELSWLIIDYNLIQTINARWFENIPNVVFLNFNFNAILELPAGLFTSFTALQDVRFWWSAIKTVDRQAFGNLGSLDTIDIDNNVVNAIEESFLWEATALQTLYAFGNLCTSQRFYNFQQNRDVFIGRLSTCTRNYRYTVDTVTEVSDQYRFFEGVYPGIQVRVNAPENVNIALTPFNFPWSPMIEIFIGVGNNTESRIVRNRETTVVTVPSPNVLEEGRWSGFRVTWSNHVVLVTREGQQFPFMAYTLEDFFPINFYGLRSPQNRASWSIQPVEAEVSPFEA